MAPCIVTTADVISQPGVSVSQSGHNKISQAKQLKQQKFIASQFGDEKSKIKVLAGLVLFEGWRKDPFCTSFLADTYAQLHGHIPPLCKDTSDTGLQAHLIQYDLILTNYTSAASQFPNKVTF